MPFLIGQSAVQNHTAVLAWLKYFHDITFAAAPPSTFEQVGIGFYFPHLHRMNTLGFVFNVISTLSRSCEILTILIP